MNDVFSRAKRSWIMSRVKNRDTAPELLVRLCIHNMGYRFRLHRKDLPGKPDIVLPRHNKLVFVHGCFWHGHRNCKRSKRPATRKRYWNAKIDGNIARYRKQQRKLRRMDWKVLTVWECETRSLEKLMKKLERFLGDE